jgi:uncharacterized membrane protein
MLTKQEQIAIATLLILDFVWIYVFMGHNYQKMIHQIQNEKMKVNMYSAIGAYILMVYLLLNVVLKYNMSLLESFLFGFSVYGIYDLTCGAIFRDWDFHLAIVDMLWGGFVYMTAVYNAKILL